MQERPTTLVPAVGNPACAEPVPGDPAPRVARDATPRWPVLFARYGDLAGLRYDYPLVLAEGAGRDAGNGALLRPLTGIINDALRETAPPGAAGEALRQQVLRLEDEIRRRVAAGELGRLSELWRKAAAVLVAASGEQPFGPLDGNLDRARAALKLDGAVIDCDAATPRSVIVHAWQARHDAKARAFRKRVDGLILRLADILKADHMRSDEAHAAEALESSVGASFTSDIDFHMLSRVLHRSHPEARLPDDRLQRIRRILMILRSQRFYGPGRASERKPGQAQAHDFVFESCGAALDAFCERLPEILDFVKALIIAELEVANKYRPSLHDPIFARFDECDLSPDQLALLPSPLVCLRDGLSDNADTVRAFEALASGLPIKVLIQTDDILGAPTPEPSRTAFGGGSARLAAMAMGLNAAFVLQASSAHLYRLADRLAAGMRFDGPALFCVYSGATSSSSHVAPYLLAAAATESRAFPSFAYDPDAGADLAARFALSGNPQPVEDWPLHQFDYEDEALQRRSEELAFTFADFAACDQRYARFCRAPSLAEADDTASLPVAEFMKLPDDEADDRAAHVLMTDAGDRLHHVIVEDKILAGARRCRDAWRRLQEFAGIDNSHARRQVAEARAAWEREATEAAPPPAAKAVAAPAPTNAAAAAPAPAMPPVEIPPTEEPPGEAAAPAPDGPWIETSRCTTCNECTQINNKLFAYDENMQAYIADPDAGSFRQIVEAAESCQVSIIHPGKPRNPDEPNLAELIERASAFN